MHRQKLLMCFASDRYTQFDADTDADSNHTDRDRQGRQRVDPGHFFRRSICSPTLNADQTQAVDRHVKTDHMGPDMLWCCPIVTRDLTRCGKQFSTKEGLLSHMRKEHNMRPVVKACVVINVCPFSSSSFRTKDHAYVHAKRALVKGYCITNCSRLPYISEDRPSRCPLCQTACETADAYDLHLRRHFAFRPPPPTAEPLLRRHGLGTQELGMARLEGARSEGRPRGHAQARTQEGPRGRGRQRGCDAPREALRRRWHPLIRG